MALAVYVGSSREVKFQGCRWDRGTKIPGVRALIVFSELTYQEVATKLKLPLGTVKTRIRSGLGKLRQMLAIH